MAGFNTPQLARTPSSQQPKEMSSRLLNMKFMQRAAAVSPTTSTPASATAHTPSIEPSAKRRRIESTTSSPAYSVPGTPTNESVNGLTAPGTARGGVSTFTRAGADTEWVVDVRLPPLQDKTNSTQKNNHNAKTNEVNGSTSRFSALAQRDEETSDHSSEESDIWNPAQPSGRQTFGSFKKRKSRIVPSKDQTHDDNDQDLSSASGSDDGSDSGEASDSENALNSDEEMRNVRRAIERKHRSMQGLGPPGRTGQSAFSKNGPARGAGPLDRGQRGQKRGREDGSYKQKKKAKNARKTI
ncbi:hypothetical protein H2200_013315 [Cladophialophora chaetospira]|uniref:Uncharacterized protein n=1 Tax=Cladophialophora chaetospira TaxID=386627 RepID=A0AA39CBB3_9EURO|nr:hypothetical protein H2200_013315 [Cladophialophora chaetospira]